MIIHPHEVDHIYDFIRSRLFFIELPKQLKECFPNFYFVFGGLEVWSFDSKQNFQNHTPPEILSGVGKVSNFEWRKIRFLDDFFEISKIVSKMFLNDVKMF